MHQFKMTAEVFSISEFIEQVKWLFEDQIKAKKLKFDVETEFEPGVLDVRIESD